ncbi:ABC transporter substrate-binding protein [bacterium]|nr:ABC transporter substrate-binding protein [bacterium]
MRNIRKIIVAVLLIAIPSSFAVGEESKVYTLGLILPFTGEGASIANFTKRSVDLAYSELSKEMQAKLKLIYADDSMDPKKSISTFQMMTDLQGVDGIICMTSGIGHALAPLAERKKKLMIDIGASDKAFAVGKDYVFIHWVSPEAEAEKMTQEIKRRGYQRIAGISHIQQGVEAYNQAFFSMLKQEGLYERLVFHEQLAVGTTDFNTTLTKLRGANADAIYLAVFSDGLATASRRIKELGIGGEIFGAEFFEDEHVVKASNGALYGSWYVNVDDATAGFVKKYQARYQEFPGLTSSNAYDTLNLIARGVELHGRDNLKIAGSLKTLKDYRGAAGVYSATEDNRFTLPAAVKIVEKDAFKKIN